MVTRPAAVACAVVAAAGALGACRPNLDETVALITGPTVLAVQLDPPEVDPSASPPTTVTLKTLFVGPAGDIDNAPIEWAFCNAREPLAELGPVNNACLQASGSQFVPIGTGIDVTDDAGVPVIACNQFGPDVPMPMMGQPPGRPVDPDSTGGYYQPERFIAPGNGADSIGIAEERIACGLSTATPDQVIQFGAEYHFNANPVVQSLSVVSSTGSAGPALVTDAMGQTNPVSAGQHITFEVAWPTCPLVDTCGDGVCGPDETPSANQTAGALMGNSGSNCPTPLATTCAADCAPTAKGCGGAERYLNLDLTSQCLVDARESIGVAWYATGGAFDDDRTGRTDTDTTTTSDNGWLAPSQAGVVELWVVLRDARGGAGWAEYKLDVQ